jgi:hypothetical protein
MRFVVRIPLSWELLVRSAYVASLKKVTHMVPTMVRYSKVISLLPPMALMFLEE